MCVCVCVCVCSQAVRYLQKVGYYKESGFSERNIHKAYEKAGKDWAELWTFSLSRIDDS